jgi:hypothetical protein
LQWSVLNLSAINRQGFLRKDANSFMAKAPPRLVQAVIPAVGSKSGWNMVLDLADEEDALEIARQLADATGRAVIVRDADMVKVQTIPAASKQ